MKAWMRWLRRWLPGFLGILLGFLAGCASSGYRVDQALRSGHGISSNPVYCQQNYEVHCPDMLEIRIAGDDSQTENCEVDPEGKIRLGDKRILVEGMKPSEISDLLSRHLGKNPDEVSVRVSQFHSQQLFLFGEVPGLQRAVEYHGPETVSELLQRIGGLNAQAAPGDVQVVRSHVAAGKPPEVFDVNLSAIVLKEDNQTNIRLMAFDQVYIGQTRQGKFCRCLPPWLRPFFERLSGIKS